jgi:NAD(P)H-dependent FMN reductase
MTYTIISGTDRPGSNTKKVALEYQRILSEKGIDAGLLALDETDILSKDAIFNQVESTYIFPAGKFIFLLPEYNGSYPGILKLLIDKTEISKAWWNKKVLLTGISTGRAGNLRGMEHLTGSLLYLKMLVHPNRLPISVVDQLMDDQGNLTDENTLQSINRQLDEFIGF